jgi:hypothetical protein
MISGERRIQMTDLLLTLWLVFGSLYALNISICLLSLHFNAKKPVSNSYIVKSIVLSGIVTIAVFPLNIFNLAPAKTKAAKLYKVLSEGYEEYQEYQAKQL